MLRFLLAGSLAALPLLASSIEVQPDCTSAPLSTYLVSKGCSISGVTFQDFKWIQTGGVTVSPADVIVTPQANGTEFGLDFSSTKFSVSGENNIIYLLDYMIDPPPPVIDRMASRLNSHSPTGNGTATVTVELCAGDLFSNNCANGVGRQLKVFDIPSGTTKLFDSVTFPPVSLVDVRTTVDLEANGDTSEITGVANTTTIGTPEPGTIGLASLGLLGLSILARSRARRRASAKLR